MTTQQQQSYSTSDSTSASGSKPLWKVSHLRMQGSKMAKATKAAANVLIIMASLGSSV